METKLIAGYARVSTEMQAERDSIINQQEHLKRFADLRQMPIRLYVDAGFSAKDMEGRSAFQDLIRGIERGEIALVVVTKLDRITRSLKDLVWLLDFFDAHGVKFISITETFDTTTPIGRFGLGLLGNVAQLERELTADRVAGDMRDRARHGKWNGGVVPHGFQWIREEKKLAVNEDEAKIIREIFDLYLKHKSFRGVVHAINSQGVRTRNGETWASSSVRRILTNPTYKGAMAYNKRKGFKRTAKPRPVEEHIVVEDALPSIITKEKFAEVQRIIAEQGHVAPASKGSTYLLTGLARCENCGGRMYGYTNDSNKDGPVYRYYRCNNHISKGASVCKGNTIDAGVLENLVIGELKKLGLNPQLVVERTGEYAERFSVEVVPLKNKESLLGGKLKELERRSMNLIELYEQTMITKEEFAARRNSLNSEKTAVEKELMNVRTELAASDLSSYDVDSILNSLRNLGEVYDQLEFSERRELLQSILESISIGQHAVTYNVFSLPGVVVDSDRMLRGSSLQ